MSEEIPLTPQLHGVADDLPVRITNDEMYRRSSQYRYWSFTKESLTDLRIKVNNKGKTIFEKRIYNLDDDSDMLIKKYITENEFKGINCSEEREIVIYYARKCQDLSNFFKFTTQVRLTAISFLFKFYLVHSVMEYYPQQIMYTCLFLSAKSENNFIGIKNFSNAIPKTTVESILQYEYLILETMRFTLTCHHPMNSLYGFFLDIQNILVKLDFNRLSKDYDTSRKIINESVFTDAQFLFTPPQIALAALYIADDVVCMRYLMRKFGVKRRQMLQQMEQNENEKEKVIVKKEDGINVDDSVTVKQEKDTEEENVTVVGDNKTVEGTPVDVKPDIKLEPESQSETPQTDTVETTATVKPTDEKNVDDIDESIKLVDDKDEEKQEVIEETPIEKYERILNIVKQCAAEIQNKIDPTVERAKIVSLKAHFCLDPVKYFKKISKDKPVVGNSNSISPDSTTTLSTTSVKREAPDDESNNLDTKRIKLES